jgi:hypothetical protein
MISNGAARMSKFSKVKRLRTLSKGINSTTFS